nr:MAG TPA: hypothetical protein [Caudoviricetes sp.]DAR22370.1 MAG TPA: hypothetical protein [Caudoviricetes sp.]
MLISKFPAVNPSISLLKGLSIPRFAASCPKVDNLAFNSSIFY